MPSPPIVQLLVPLAGGLGVLLFVRAAVLRRKRNPRRLPLPPGPKGLPIIGSALQIPDPSQRPWERYDALCKQYGGMVYMVAMGQGFFVLGDLTRATDILEKRSVIYSDRPTMPSLELIGQGFSFGMMNYGLQWRAYRRAFYEHLNRNAVTQYYPVLYEEMANLLHQLQEQPADFTEHLKLYFGKAIMRTAYGIDDMNQNEVFIHNAEAIVEAFGDVIVPGKYLVNIFPVLRHVPGWVPGAGFQKVFKKALEITRKAVALPYDEAKVNLAKGMRSTHPSMAVSFIDNLLADNESNRQELEERAKNVCATAYIAGADTTVASATALILALASHREVQKKGQAELDAIVGSDRLPLITDRPKLPYVHAVVKELSRWHSTTPLGVAHCSSTDDEYDGYFIPKGTLVIPNSWAILHNPETFEQPFEFIPERYMKDGEIDMSVVDPEVAAFGFGRRICPGRHFSNDALFLLAASLFATFDITPPNDEAGNPIPLNLEVTSQFIAKPLPFQCNFTLRSKREI